MQSDGNNDQTTGRITDNSTQQASQEAQNALASAVRKRAFGDPPKTQNKTEKHITASIRKIRGARS